MNLGNRKQHGNIHRIREFELEKVSHTSSTNDINIKKYLNHLFATVFR